MDSRALLEPLPVGSDDKHSSIVKRAGYHSTQGQLQLAQSVLLKRHVLFFRVSTWVIKQLSSLIITLRGWKAKLLSQHSANHAGHWKSNAKYDTYRRSVTTGSARGKMNKMEESTTHWSFILWIPMRRLLQGWPSCYLTACGYTPTSSTRNHCLVKCKSQATHPTTRTGYSFPFLIATAAHNNLEVKLYDLPNTLIAYNYPSRGSFGNTFGLSKACDHTPTQTELMIKIPPQLCNCDHLLTAYYTIEHHKWWHFLIDGSLGYVLLFTYLASSLTKHLHDQEWFPQLCVDNVILEYH